MQPFDELEELVDALARGGVRGDPVSLDLGLARGISYYTGVIFDLTHLRGAREVSVGGGGRYDGLVRALGGDEDVPASGFAYSLDAVIESLGSLHEAPARASTRP